ncbi:MAG: glycine zipper domain-containing protein, partial [Verrucomicrobiales bacterium]
MKNIFLLPLLGAIAICGTSCYSDYGTVHTKRGTVVGGLLGAGAGAVIGNQSDRPLEGAAIGGAVGALTGGLLGSARDEAYSRSYPPPPPPPPPP